MRRALPQAQAVQVQHLHLHGPAAALLGARQHLAAWQAAAWPGTGDGEVLLLRRLHLRGPGAALGEVAAAEARALASRACGPWGPGADSAPALRFGSQAEYLAWQVRQHLLASHRLGVAGQAEAIADLLCQRPLALPSVCEHLQRVAPGSGLARLGRALDAPSAQRLLASVAAATGWGRSLSTRSAAAPASGMATLPAPATALQGDDARQARQALAGLPPADARVRLVALVLLWQRAPARLAAGDAAALLWQLAGQLADPPPPPPRPAGPVPGPAPAATVWWRDGGPETQADHTATAAPARPPGTASSPGAGPAPTAPARESTTPHPSPPSPPSPRSSSADAGADRPGPGQFAGPGHTRDTDPGSAPGAGTGTGAAAGSGPFITRHGGVFFLLQVLTGPLFQQRLASLPTVQAGWRDWLGLAHALGAQLDGNLLAFAARAALLDDPGQAAALRWPKAVARPLLQAAEARWGRAALQAAIAPRPARVVASATQVDVHFRLADAALAVRRVGLDADPGWQPWLGRVLRWHYGSPLAPQWHESPPPASPPAAGPTPEPPP